jgi:hypothetical protein
MRGLSLLARDRPDLFARIFLKIPGTNRLQVLPAA